MDLNLIDYRGVPPELIAEIGMLTIAAAALDEAVYALGEELGHAPGTLRRKPSRTAIEIVQKKLRADASLPASANSSLTLEAITDWLRAADACILGRNLVIHASIGMQRRHGEDWTFAFFGQRPDRLVRPATVTEVRDLRERIDRLLAQMIPLRMGLLRQLQPGVYVSHYGRSTP